MSNGAGRQPESARGSHKMASEIPAHVLPVASLPEATFLRHFEGRSFAMEFRASAEGSVAPRVGMRSVADGPGPSMSYKGGLHPVDELQQRMVRDDINGRIQRIRHMHGNGAALIAQMELAVVSQAQRLPGLRSSNIGLETLLNTGASLDVTDYLNDPDYSECPRDSRAIMERRLGLL